MNLVSVRLQDLQPYENNPRINDNAIDSVANSIKEFGFKVPIVITKDNVIVAGHTRYKASLQLGLEEVPCIIAGDLTDEQIKAFRLADNKVSELADWDFEKLEQELAEISLDMSLFSFDLENDSIFTDDFEDVQPRESEDKPTEKLSDVNVRIGEYTFVVERAEYENLVEEIQITIGYAKDEVIGELKRRLLCN